MKQLLIILLAFVLFVQCKQDGVIIKVKIVGDPTETFIMYHLVDEDYKIDTLYVDDKQSLVLTLGNNDLEELSFRYGRTILKPVVNIGDEMEIFLQKNEQTVDVSYKGDGALVNNYKLDREKELGYGLSRQLYGNNQATQAFTMYNSKLDSMHTSWLTKLEELGTKDFNFLEAERKYLNYYFIYVKSVYPWYMTRQTGKPFDADKDYNEFINDVLEDKEDEHVEMYKNIFDQKVSWYVAVKREQYELGDSAAIVELKTINRVIQSSDLKNNMLSRSMGNYLSFSVNSLIQETYDTYLSFCTNEEQKQRIAELFNNAKKLLPGQPAPDFDMYTKEGEKVMLSDFKGKFVYFDVWATWCGPCKAEIPHLAVLVEALKDEKDVEIISVSVDSDHEAWVEMIEEDQPQWKQFIVKDAFGSALTKQYNISGIPQFVLIDPEGNIVDVQAARPSNPNLLTTLKTLLSEN